jgi:hypothetical protein
MDNKIKNIKVVLELYNLIVDIITIIILRRILINKQDIRNNKEECFKMRDLMI